MKFIGLSGIGWLLDFCTYTGMGFLSENLILNNIVSSWVGATFVFIFASKKLFHNNSKIPLRWKYLVYIAYQCILIIFISILLNHINFIIISHIDAEWILKFSSIISKVFVTPITMTINFFVMKGLIERL